MCANEHPAGEGNLPTGERTEQELFMSKTTIAAVVAALGLSVLAGCNQSRQEEFTIVEPVQPIYVEPVARSKYR